MSTIMSRVAGKGKTGNSWTQEDIRLAVGMQIAEAGRKAIADATGHPESSVTYLFNTKLTRKVVDASGKQVTETRTKDDGTEYEVKLRRKVTDAELFEQCGVENEDEIVEFAEARLAEANESTEAAS